MKKGVGSIEGLVESDGAVELTNEGASDERNDGLADGTSDALSDTNGDGGFDKTGSTLSELSPSSGKRGAFFVMSFETYATLLNRNASDTIRTPTSRLFFRSPACGSKTRGLRLQLSLLLPRLLSLSAHSTSRSGWSSLKSFQL